MKNKRWLGLLAAALFCGTVQARDAMSTLAPAGGAPEKRSALVIGNASYAYGTLKNPLNDARAVARALAAAGFEVTLLEDGTQAGMQRAIRRFADQIEQGGVGLFYYAGHGMQVKGRNFLVPVNAEIEREYEIEYGSVDVNLVLSMMDAAKNPLNIVVLDACRNNPFARSFRVSASGLAPMDAPVGTFIAFATAPGAIAGDGSGDNGVYTKHLLAHLGQPGLPIEQLFKQVRIGVIEETRGEQTPWESSSLRGEFAFHPGAPAGAAAAQLVAEALKREREAYLKETEALIQAALERQRRELEDAARKVPAAQAVAPSVASEPWSYRLIDARGRSRQLSADEAILSQYLVRLDGRLWTGRRFSAAGALDERSCKAPYLCSSRGRVVRRETLQLAGDSVETMKVVIEQSWQPKSLEPGASSQNAELWGMRVVTAWYSPADRRVVKVTSRLRAGRYPPMEANFDLELVGYRAPQTPMTQVAIRGGAK